jgi:hypothetical protein
MSESEGILVEVLATPLDHGRYVEYVSDPGAGEGPLFHLDNTVYIYFMIVCYRIVRMVGGIFAFMLIYGG